jgi:hypothetical protein
MRCTACGSEAAPGARFCAACGARLAAELPAAGPLAPLPAAPLPPAPSPTVPVTPSANLTAPYASHQMQASPGHGVHLNVNVNVPAHRYDHDHEHERGLARRPGVFCQSCGQRTMPMPYFARGLNVAKAAVLFPFSVFGPLLLFLIRKDRVVCGNCKALLPGEVHIPLTDTFNPAPRSLESHQQALARRQDPALVEKDLVSQEVAHLERSSRRRQGKAVTYGVTAGLLVGAGGLAAVNGGPEQLFFALGGLSGVGAVTNGRRSRRDGVEAAAKKQRQRVLEILGLARQHGGRLTVTLVASHMQIDFREAEALLDSMVDGRRVDVHVDDQGRISYVFPELSP